MLRYKTRTGICLVGLLLFPIGCANPDRYGESWTVGVISAMPPTNLIFNPESTRVAYGLAREPSSWPSTAVYTDPGDQITYRESVLDFQGRSTAARGQDYYRRFSSVRTGRGRR